MDPYYLTYKAQEVGHHPELILAGRRVNDGMGKYVAGELVKELVKLNHVLKGARVLIMGFAFKENVRDFRNTRVMDIVSELEEFALKPVVWDPLVDREDAFREYGHFEMVSSADELKGGFCSILLAVPHRAFREVSLAYLRGLCLSSPKPVMFDVRWFFNEEEAKREGFHYISL